MDSILEALFAAGFLTRGQVTLFTGIRSQLVVTVSACDNTVLLSFHPVQDPKILRTDISVEPRILRTSAHMRSLDERHSHQPFLES